MLGASTLVTEDFSDQNVEDIARRIRPLHVLLVEDNPVSRRMLTLVLTKRGHSVVQAEDGQAALEALSRGKFDLILMDVEMPNLDGLDATRAIREMESTSGAHIPIIAMTAHAMEGDREMCLEAGMDDYVSKPISAAELFGKIDEITKQARTDDTAHS
jgi:CheY-like chemotaxis protein